jgi:hypothetical protein
MQRIGRRFAVAIAVLCGTVGFVASAGFGQADPTPDESVAPETPSATGGRPATTPTEPTTPRTTTTLAPCEKTADIAVTFVGHPVIRAATIITFEVDDVIAGKLADGTTDVNFPLDDRFLFDGHRYRISASYDAESKVYVSKVRPPRYTAAHCLAKDKIFTTHEDGSAIDTGIFSGMHGQWKFVPLDFLYPLGGAVGLLLVLVLIKRVGVLGLRAAFRRGAHQHGARASDS